jgi:hypothetical protein
MRKSAASHAETELCCARATGHAAKSETNNAVAVARRQSILLPQCLMDFALSRSEISQLLSEGSPKVADKLFRHSSRPDGGGTAICRRRREVQQTGANGKFDRFPP